MSRTEGSDAGSPGAGSPGAASSRVGPAAPGLDLPLREALRPSGPARFELRTERHPDSVLVHVEGELDVLTVPKLAARLNGIIRTCTMDVVLDLRAVRFIDSAGLQLLLTTRRRLLVASRNLSVICDEGPVRRIIELARLTEVLRVSAS